MQTDAPAEASVVAITKVAVLFPAPPLGFAVQITGISSSEAIYGLSLAYSVPSLNRYQE